MSIWIPLGVRHTPSTITNHRRCCKIASSFQALDHNCYSQSCYEFCSEFHSKLFYNSGWLASRSDISSSSSPSSTSSSANDNNNSTVKPILDQSLSQTLLSSCPRSATRLPLSGEDDTPKRSQMVLVVSVDHDGNSSTSSVYVAEKTNGGVYYLALCDFESGNASKIFLVNGDEGLTNLRSENPVHTVYRKCR